MDITEDKQLALLHQLYHRTVEEKIPWEQTADENIYLAAFPQNTIEIIRVIKATMSDLGRSDYELVIRNEHGRAILVLGSYDFQDTQEFKAEQILEAIFEQARRQTTDTDNVYAIDVLLRTLTEMDNPKAPPVEANGTSASPVKARWDQGGNGSGR